MNTTPPGTVDSAAPLAFADARGCKEWLGALPFTHVAQTQALVLEGLRALDAADFAGLERLKCMELLRDKVAFLQGESRARYAGKPVPLSAGDAAAWGNARALQEALETGYRRCGDDPALTAHAALVAQRVLRAVGAQMALHALVYRAFDARLWNVLHDQYASAEAGSFASERVKDSLEGGEEGASSVLESYVQVVLLQAAGTAEMSVAQMEYANTLLHLWARKVRICDRAAASAGPVHPLVVDLAMPLGARAFAHDALEAGHRVLEVDGLSPSLRKRIAGLQNHEEPAKLGLPPEGAGVAALPLLLRLHRAWCEGAPGRSTGKASEVKAAGLVFGLAEIHFFVSGGKPFEQPDRSRELTTEEKQDIEVFGRVTERTHSRMQPQHTYTVESWPVIDEQTGVWRVQRPQSVTHGVAFGRLVGIRLGDTAPFFLGMVSAVAHEADGRLVVTVSLFPGRPEAIAVRATDARNRPNSQWLQGFRLPALERMRIPASLVVPSAMAPRGRGVETWVEGPEQGPLQDFLERGSDFDRVTLSSSAS